jgi:hypothetical protein
MTDILYKFKLLLQVSHIGTMNTNNTNPPKTPVKRNPKHNKCFCDCKCNCRQQVNYVTLAPKRIKTEDGYMLACSHFSSCPYNRRRCAFEEVRQRVNLIETCKRYGTKPVSHLDLDEENIFC